MSLHGPSRSRRGTNPATGTPINAGSSAGKLTRVSADIPWLDLQVLAVPYEPTWRTWYLWGNAQLIDDGIGFEVDFRRCPFIGRAS